MTRISWLCTNGFQTPRNCPERLVVLVIRSQSIHLANYLDKHYTSSFIQFPKKKNYKSLFFILDLCSLNVKTHNKLL